MKKKLTAAALIIISFLTNVRAADWHQGSGPDGSFQGTTPGPIEWSVALKKQIKWKLSLPETGQNTPVISNGKVFFSTYVPFEKDTKTGKDIIAWCCDARTGNQLWQRQIPAQYNLRVSGCFSDSTAPPAVSDGEYVVFVNASGAVECFNHAGDPIWRREFLSVGRTVPFLHDGKVIFTRQQYPPEPNGRFPHKYKNAPKEMWTQLQALDIRTGEIVWTSDCGCNLGMTMMPQKLDDGRDVVVVGRGGGHGPPEKPLGISLIDLADGSTAWTLPIEDFAATMTYGIRNNQVHIFHGMEHLSVDCEVGKVVKRISFHENVPVRLWNEGKRTTEVQSIDKGKSRNITQGSNLLVGRWNYFRHYKKPWLGRINVETGRVEYLELPLQLSRVPGEADQLNWYDSNGGKLETQTIVPNDMKNSRGLVVFDDKRCAGNGWGHIASPTPTVAGEHLYLPVMTGTVYVINWGAETLDESAIIAINDLGVAGQSFTRGSISFANGHAYAHTIKELICIGE